MEKVQIDFLGRNLYQLTYTLKYNRKKNLIDQKIIDFFPFFKI